MARVVPALPAMTRRMLRSAPLAIALITAACGGKAADSTAAGGPSAASAQDPGGSIAPVSTSSPSFCAESPADDQLSRRIFDRLAPAVAADYLALRRFEVSVPTRRDTDPGLVTLTERGTACARASDAARCKKAYAALAYDQPWAARVYFTRADTVGIVKNANDAIALIGAVDSPEKAYFVAGEAGFRFSCGGVNAAAYRVTEDGFEIVTEVGGCGRPVERVTVHVHANGAIEEVDRLTTEAVTPSCGQP